MVRQTRLLAHLFGAFGVCIGVLISGVRAALPDVLNPEDYPKISEREFQLLEEYLVAYKKLKSFYQNVRVTAKVREYRFESDAARRNTPSAELPPLAGVTDWSYVACGGREFRVESIRYDRDDSTSVRRHGVLIANPQESFRLGRDLDTKQYFLRSHGKTFEDDLDWITSYRFSVVPFSTGRGALLEDIIFFPKPGRVIESVTETGPDDVTIRTATQGEKGSASFSIQLLKSRCWAMSRFVGESEMPEMKDRVVYSSTCTYGGDVDGIPLVESLVTEIRGATGDLVDLQTRQRDEYQISVVPESGNDTDFDVAVLLPEFQRLGQPRAGGQRSLLVLNGLLLLAIALALAIWSRRTARKH